MKLQNQTLLLAWRKKRFFRRRGEEKIINIHENSMFREISNVLCSIALLTFNFQSTNQKKMNIIWRISGDPVDIHWRIFDVSESAHIM